MKKHVILAATATATNGALGGISDALGGDFDLGGKFDLGAIFDKVREIFQKIVDFFRNLFNANK